MLKIAQCNESAVRAIEAELGLPSLIARILVARGFHSPDAVHPFLSPKLESLSDPYLLPDMEKGVAKTVEAIETGRKIALFGDYDADGITSVALMKNFLKHLDIVPDVSLPRRQDGYGLNERTVQMFSEQDADLLICLDCGSSNKAEIESAHQLGIQVIVLDHHEVPDTPAQPYALINPKRQGSRFPTRELAACGVTFFFLVALRRALAARHLLPNSINLKREMDLVAVGTVADMVPLTGDNRLLVRFGLETMRKRPRTWFKSFLKKHVVRRGRTDEFTLGFGVAPRINAAGRVADPQIALSFLTADLEIETEEYLLRLNEANRKRQDLEESILREALEQLEMETVYRENSIVLFHQDWPIGVLGIVAHRLVDRTGKPAIVLTRTEKAWRGSARGLEGMDLHGTISSLAPLFLAFGGHRHACGITLREENLLPLRDAFETEVRTSMEGFVREVAIDAVAGYEDLTKEVVEMIDLFAPFGIGNPRPNLLLPPSAVSLSNGFARITDSNKRTWRGSVQKGASPPGAPVARVVAAPTMREEMGEKFIHLLIKDFIPAE